MYYNVSVDLILHQLVRYATEYIDTKRGEMENNNRRMSNVSTKESNVSRETRAVLKLP